MFVENNMKKYEFTFLQRFKHFAILSLVVFITTPMAILLLILATLLKFILSGIIGVIKSGFFGDTFTRVCRVCLLWFYTLKLLFKQNRRNIALYITLCRELKLRK